MDIGCHLPTQGPVATREALVTFCREEPTNRVTGILNGQRAITGDTALRLGHFFGTSPEFWLKLQSLYELRLAEQRAGKTIKALPTLKRRQGRHGRQPAHA